MGDKEGRGGELLVLPGEPELVATVPRQGVEVGEEGGLLHVLPQEGVEGGKGGPVPVVDVSCRAHFKTVHCALVVCDICELFSFEMIIKFHKANKTHQIILKTSWKNPANILGTSREHL